MRNHIKQLEDEYKQARKKFMLGQLDLSFYENYIPRLKRAIDSFNESATPKEKQKYDYLFIGAQAVLLDGLYWIGRNIEVEELVRTLETVVSDVMNIADSIGRRGTAAKLSKLSGDERQLIREKVRITIIYALMIHYHRHNYDEAEEHLTKCIKVLDHTKDSNDLNFFSTRAISHYHLSRISRNRHLWRDSEVYLRNAMDLHLKRVEFKKQHLTPQQKVKDEIRKELRQELQQELAFSRYRIAIFLALGRGWLNFQGGLLWIALYNNVIPARIILEETEDLVNKGFLQLFEGCIRRELYADNEEELRSSLSLITTARDVFFTKMEHQRFIELADYEEVNTILLLCALLAKQNRQQKRQGKYLNEGLKTLQRLKLCAKNRKDVRWKSQYLTLESKIEYFRGSYQRAAELAQESIKDLDTGDRDKVYKIEALIAESTAYIALGRFAEAITDLETARSLNRDKASESVPVNPKLEAVVYITLTRAYTRQGEFKKAGNYLENARTLTSRVENTIVKDMFKEAEGEIGEAHGFSIDLDYLDINQNVERLKSHLSRLALELTGGNVSKAAKLLGKDKSSVFRYRKVKGD